MQYSIIQKSQLEGASRLDPEYFQPEYLELEKNILQTNQITKWREIGGKFITGPFGSEFNVENYEDNGEHRYVRGKDVKLFFLSTDDNVYLPKSDYERLIKYSLAEGDILISVVGTLGNAAIVNNSNLPAIFSSKSTAFRSKDINAFYLLAYLNSKYGQGLLLRCARGQVQKGLNIEDLKSLSVYVPSSKVQDEIASIIKKSYVLLEQSKSIYQSAENLLLKELGFSDFEISQDLSYVVNFSEVKNANRIDADYFQPKYEKLISKIRNQNIKFLSEVIENIPAKFNPLIKPEQVFDYVELANINSSIGLIDGFSEVLGKEAPSRARRVLKLGDVIISSVEGSLEKVALVNADQEEFLASTGFFQFRSNKILPEVILVLAKSIVFQMQMQKETAGTILAAVPKEAVKNVLVPVLPKETQQIIADLVKKSHEARKKSKDFLEKAKKKVEEMIEGKN